MQTIIVDNTARDQIAEILADGGKYVRAFIKGGGCSGFNYGFIVEDEKEDDDMVIDNLIIDSMSMQYFNNATISFLEDKLKGSSFIISNPNAKSTCGCGSSFSI